MGPLGEIFNPGIRHEREERQSKAVRREEEGNARDGDDVRIDFTSGVAIIDPNAAAAREKADEQARLERERRTAAARRKARRRAAAASSGESRPVTEPAGQPAGSAGPRTKASRSTD